MTKSFKKYGLITGLLLGLGAPIGSLFFGLIFFGRMNFDWVGQEISSRVYYYAYMSLLTPLVFGLFGSYLGGLNDKIHSQNKSLEGLMSVLETQSMTDDVTGLYNHRHLVEEIEKEVERSKRHNHFLSGMMIDIDGFKEINDLYGHLTGDTILREVAFVLNESIRKIDIIGRYGGDEFVIILPEAKLDAAEVVSKRILQNIRQHRFKTKRDYVSLTVSGGLFSFEDASNLDKMQFIEKIDQAMFQAKGLGKNRVFAVS